MILDGYAKQRATLFEATRAANHELAHLISFAQHSPKKIPKYKPLKKPKARKAPTKLDREQGHAAMVAWAMRNQNKG